ncbi:hypothetical protein QUB60_12530 [Microcoleus sp. A2-C5]|uniref:hypothetical protein n=1 Tax=Microcoleaceae TaxID=1892252 RepID=UPI002238A7AE|nr:hypothetical protein [Lyngbya sp. CCAP 1446/10]MCW6052907.1 hypothetical protein [Lyngbya sp. CCAP 1446/10]
MKILLWDDGLSKLGLDLEQKPIARNGTNHIISAEKPQCRLKSHPHSSPKPHPPQLSPARLRRATI